MKCRLIAAALVLMSVAGMASADTLDVVGDATWYPFPTPSTSGTPFWNTASFDGPQCNVGYWLKGAAACPLFNGPSPQITPPFLGNQNTTFSFQKTPDTASVTVTSRLEVTDYRNVNEVGWFHTADPVNNPATFKPLFTGAPTVGSSVTFVPSGPYGFYLKSPEGKYLSTGTGDTRTHFVVFQLAGAGSFMLGIEDMWNAGDWDYNDLVFEIVQDPVPEPATLALLGAGLAWIGGRARRRRTAGQSR